MGFLREWFATFRQISDESGVPVLMVYLTQVYAENPRGAKASQAFRKVAAEVDLPYFDTNPYFQGRELYDTIIFKNDTHPNVLGHALLADALYDLLRSGDWIAP
jgi:lysophospholipase L1-like esterase